MFPQYVISHDHYSNLYNVIYIFPTDIVTRAVLFALSNYLWFVSYVMVGMLDDNSNRSVKTALAVRHPECVRIHFAIVIFVSRNHDLQSSY